MPNETTRGRFWAGWWVGVAMTMFGNVILPYWGPSTGLWFLQHGWGCHREEINNVR